jgi:molecular chaperone GrpE
MEETKKQTVDSETFNKLKVQADEYLNGWKRALADYQNFKKNSEKKSRDLQFYQIAEFIRNIIPIVELNQTALDHVPGEYKKTGWYVGIEQINKRWHELFEKFNVKATAKVGGLFNPERHEAVEKKSVLKKKDQEILIITQQGYTIGDRLIKPAQVVVNSLNQSNK